MNRKQGARSRNQEIKKQDTLIEEAGNKNFKNRKQGSIKKLD